MVTPSTAPAEPTPEIETTPPEGAVQEGAEQKPKFVTQEDLAQALAASQEQVLKRAGQSTRALITNKLEQYNQMVKVQEKAGTPIAPEAQAAARQQITQDVLTGEGEEEVPPAPGAQVADDAWQVYVAEQVRSVFDDVGVQVKPGDPEWAAVEKAFKTKQPLAKLLVQVHAQASIKKTCTASEQNSAEARVGTGGGTTAGGAAAKSAHDLWVEASKPKS